MPISSSAQEQETQAPLPGLPQESAGRGDDIVVTGTLIRGGVSQLPVPVTTITPRDLIDRGYVSVADALQRSSFATGNVQNAKSGFTQGANTVSLFGLGPGFTKFLIDGRPTVNYPALYANQTTFFDTSAIPTALIESVEILPGGQSSLYGSDAIAGVVNIRLKKRLDGPVAEARAGFHEHGGGRSLRFSLANSFSTGPLTVLLGGQYEDVTPLWAFQRDLTRTAFDRGSSPFEPEPVFALLSPFFEAYTPPAGSCERVSGLAFGNVRAATGPTGTTCANVGATTRTLLNRERRAQGYAHLTYDLDGGATVYADVLANRSRVGYTYALQGPDLLPENFAFSEQLGGPFGFFRTFTPEEVGGLDRLLSFDRLTSLSTTFGIRGKLGARWDYDATFVHARQDLRISRREVRRDATDAYFGSILGPVLGTIDDPDFGEMPVHAPDLTRFFSPVPTDMAQGFFDFSETRAKSRTSWARVLASTPALLTLPGGDAGLALGAEAGAEVWDYAPDDRVNQGVFRGQSTDLAGRGTRRSLAAISELRLPVLSFLTVSGSARYDRYFVEGAGSTGKASWNVAAELTPVEQLSLRARHGTAFKAPTLADLFLARSSRIGFSRDFGRCARLGFTIAKIAACPNATTLYSLETEGNPALRPLTASVSDFGATLRPFRGAQLRLDYLRWRIDDGIAADDANAILQRESLCVFGQLDAATCAQTAALITRNPRGGLVSVLAAKRNITRTWNESLVVDGDMSRQVGDLGLFGLRASWTYMLASSQQPTDASPVQDTLTDPRFNSAPRSRVNGWVNWNRKAVGVNLGFERSSSTPNFIASSVDPNDPAAGRVKGWTVWTGSVNWQATKAIGLALTANNLFDRDPPIDFSTPGFSNSPFPVNANVFGRQVLMQANVAF